MSVPEFVRRGVLGLFLAVFVIVSFAAVPAGRRATAIAESAATLEIVIQLDSAEVAAGEMGAWVPVRMTNILQEVGGFEISLTLDRPDLFNFPGDSTVETTVVCIDPIDCDPADTTIDTVLSSIIDTVGSAISSWEFIQARAQSPISMKVAALADEAGGAPVPPLSPGGPRLLCQVWLDRIVPQQVLDTLTDRTTRIFIDRPASLSTPDGRTIGRLDSTVCLNPPACTQLDTVYYNDTTAIAYFNGARTFVESCTRGDVNESGAINSADIIYLVNFVFKGGPGPTCGPTAGDVNCNGATNSSDIIFLVNFVFKGGSPPPTSC